MIGMAQFDLYKTAKDKNVRQSALYACRMQSFIWSGMDNRIRKVNSAADRLSKWRELELRRQTRMNEKKCKVQIFYERTLPIDIDLSKASLVERRYVTNSKLGKVYELRQESVPKHKAITMEKSPTRMQENNIWLWQNEDKLTNYLHSRGHKTVRPRHGIRLTNLRRSSEILPDIKSIPTYEDLPYWAPSKSERFRQRSLSLTGNQNNGTESDAIGTNCRERSKSFSDCHGFRRPILTASTFSRPASESELSSVGEQISKSTALLNTETDSDKKRVSLQ